MISICLWKMSSVAQGSNGKMVSIFFSVPKIRQIHDFLSFILKNFHLSLSLAALLTVTFDPHMATGKCPFGL